MLLLHSRGYVAVLEALLERYDLVLLSPNTLLLLEHLNLDVIGVVNLVLAMSLGLDLSDDHLALLLLSLQLPQLPLELLPMLGFRVLLLFELFLLESLAVALASIDFKLDLPPPVLECLLVLLGLTPQHHDLLDFLLLHFVLLFHPLLLELEKVDAVLKLQQLLLRVLGYALLNVHLDAFFDHMVFVVYFGEVSFVLRLLGVEPRMDTQLAGLKLVSFDYVARWVDSLALGTRVILGRGVFK